MSCVLLALCLSSGIQGDRFTLSYIYLPLNQSTKFLWCELILSCGRGGRRREHCFWGSPGRISSFVGKLYWLLLPLSWRFSFLFVWWPVMVHEAKVSDLAHSGWGVKCWGPFCPLPWKNKFLAPVHCNSEKKAAHDFQDFVSFFQTKTLERVAPSSPLSQSIVVYSSEHLISIWRGWGGQRPGGVRSVVVSENSPPKSVNTLYQISLNEKFNCCLLFDYVLYLYSKLCGQKFLYQYKLLLFSSQTGAKCKNFEFTVSTCHSLVCSWC